MTWKNYLRRSENITPSIQINKDPRERVHVSWPPLPKNEISAWVQVRRIQRKADSRAVFAWAPSGRPGRAHICVDSTSTWQRGPLGETGFWRQGHAPGPTACCAHARDLKTLHNLEWG